MSYQADDIQGMMKYYDSLPSHGLYCVVCSEIAHVTADDRANGITPFCFKHSGQSFIYDWHRESSEREMTEVQVYNIIIEEL